ncbi:hypothetical protein GCM10010222_68980 [Streptomyces tanashiensis]|nr:hypothetical protein GCM10010222_68980 [Streptomyces tanashiensis]
MALGFGFADADADADALGFAESDGLGAVGFTDSLALAVPDGAGLAAPSSVPPGPQAVAESIAATAAAPRAYVFQLVRAARMVVPRELRMARNRLLSSRF